MMKKIRFSLTVKSILAFLAVLLPIIVIFFLTYKSNRGHVERLVLDNLKANAEDHEGNMLLFMEMARNRIEDFASDGHIRGDIERINAGKASGDELSRYLFEQKLPLEKNFYRLSVISIEGKVAASTVDATIGTDEGGEEFFLRGVQGPAITERYRGYMGEPELAVSSPVTSLDGRRIGVLAGFVPLSRLGDLLTGEFRKELEAVTLDKLKAHETMEAYLVNRDKLMITESLFTKGAVLNQRVDTPPVNSCLSERREVTGFYKDYRGVEVAGSATCLPALGWTLVVEIDKDEALKPVSEIGQYAIVTMVATIALISALFVFFLRFVIRQLKELALASRAIAAGDYDISLPVRTSDEIGVLTESFNAMAWGIKERTLALMDTEERLRGILDNTSNIIYLKDLDGRYLLINPRYEELFHIKKEEISGKTDFDIFPAGLAEKFRANDLMALESEAPVEFEELAPHEDGLHTYISVKFRIKDPKGVPYAVAGISTDITERKRAEEALRKSEARLANAQRIAHIGNWEWDIQKDEVFRSDEVYRIFGLKTLDSDLPFGAFFNYIHPDDRERVKNAIDDALYHGAEYYIDFRIIPAVGGEKIVHSQAEAVFDEKGKPLTMSGIIQDITERKLAEEELKKSEERLAYAQKTAHIGNYAWDIIKKDLFWSEELYRIHGLPEGIPVTFDTFANAIQKDDRKRVLQAIDDALYHRRQYSIDYRTVASDGLIKIIHAEGEVFFDNDGKPLKMTGTCQDITELKRAEEEIRKLNEELEKRVTERTAELKQAVGELEAANRELETFSYSVAHDLRAPLRIVDGFSKVLLEDYDDKLDKEGRDHLRRVRSASSRMGQLIDDLLNLSHVMRAGMTAERVDLTQMAKAIAADLRKLQPERNVEFIIEGGLSATGDKRLLRIALENLLGNAWKFTSRKDYGRIELRRAGEEEGKTIYSVMDNGAGFDMKYAERLFGPFQRLHSADEFPGTGIGLATVARIVHRHGGRIWAEGEPGKGAVFYFTL
ncbi:MAG: PAS domain-containing protein [Deltaproteobacteria bacterium]|nr:PAS domain-containing protein [Deltaproteobacteria bacterium]